MKTVTHKSTANATGLPGGCLRLLLLNGESSRTFFPFRGDGGAVAAEWEKQ